MGSQPTKSKLSKLIKECSKTNYSKNNIYKIECQNDQEMDLYIEDEDILFNKYHSQDDSPVFYEIKNSLSFPYISFGTIYLKLENGETKEQICFLIYKKIIATYFPFYEVEKIIEAHSSFSDELLNLDLYQKYEEKNLAIFFLENIKYSKWLGLEQYEGYLEEQKKTNKNNRNKQKKYVKIIFIKEKKELERTSSIISIEEKIDNYIVNDNSHILVEFYCDYKDLTSLKDLKNIQNEKQIIGGVIYYKNNKGGAYVIGLIDENLSPILFDRETINFLYNILFGEKHYSISGIDENVIELNLSKRNIGPHDIQVLTEFNLINLKKLNLLKNRIGPQGAFYLGQSNFNSLEILILNFNDIGDEGIEYLSKGPFLNLKYLYLFHNNITNEGMNFILESIFIDTLVLLDLSDNPHIDIEGIQYIKEKMQKNSNVLKNLRNLNLSFININDKALDVIKNINFPKLKNLVLNGIKFSNFENINDVFKNQKYEVDYDINHLL